MACSATGHAVIRLTRQSLAEAGLCFGARSKLRVKTIAEALANLLLAVPGTNVIPLPVDVAYKASLPIRESPQYLVY